MQPLCYNTLSNLDLPRSLTSDPSSVVILSALRSIDQRIVICVMHTLLGIGHACVPRNRYEFVLPFNTMYKKETSTAINETMTTLHSTETIRAGHRCVSLQDRWRTGSRPGAALRISLLSREAAFVSSDMFLLPANAALSSSSE